MGAVLDFTLPDLGGEPVALEDLLAGRRGAVVVFWSGLCAHCERYDGYLGAFAAAHPPLALVAIACRQGEDLPALREVVHRRQLRFPILHDAERQVSRAWQVRQTPRVFLVDAARRLLYRGAIDNFKYPRDRDHAPYLETAIADYLGGRPVARPETPSFGCPLESVYYLR